MRDTGSHPAPLSRNGVARRWLFRLVVFMGLAAAAEGSSYLTYWALDGHPFRRSAVNRQRRGLWAQGQARGPAVPVRRVDADQTTETFHVDVHPYLGFSYDPEWRGKLIADNPIADWGFTDRLGRSPVRRRGPGKAVVAILGASVASIFSANGTDALARELQKAPAFAGKEVEFVNLAVGAFKQPQQVMALNYALALGAEFDAALNLDGLNEIAWYRQGNGAAGIFHLYPSGWHGLAADMPDPVSRRLVGKIAYLAEERAQWAGLFQREPLRWSMTANLVWKVRDRLMAADITRTELLLQSRKRDHLPYRARGPHNDFHDDAGMQAQLVANWERCSLLLDRTCKAHGIRYYHFLQPNQYVPGSKPLSAEEQKVAIWHDLPARGLIEQGYPLLREAGRRLAAQGVRFHDLSMAFATNHRTLYFDNCCHLNRDGNEVLAEAIARAIAETPEPPPADSHAHLAAP